MLYVPPAHREQDLATLHAHIAATGLATLVTVGEDGPLVSHLPLLLDPAAGRYGELTGHLARANPQWRTSDLRKPALAIFMGPDAYVSPSWYPAKQEHGRVVPTWNYSTVHARGTLEVFDDPQRLAALVTRLTDLHEGRLAAPWKVTDAPADYLQSSCMPSSALCSRSRASTASSSSARTAPWPTGAGWWRGCAPPSGPPTEAPPTTWSGRSARALRCAKIRERPVPGNFLSAPRACAK